MRAEEVKLLRFRSYESLENMLRANPTFTGYLSLTWKHGDALKTLSSLGFRLKEIQAEETRGSIDLLFSSSNGRTVLVKTPGRLSRLEFSEHSDTVLDSEAFRCEIDARGSVRKIEFKKDWIAENSQYAGEMLDLFFGGDSGKGTFYWLVREMLVTQPDCTAKQMIRRVVDFMSEWVARESGHVYAPNGRYVIRDYDLYDVVNRIVRDEFVDIVTLNKTYQGLVEMFSDFGANTSVRLERSDPYKPDLSSVVSKTYTQGRASLKLTVCNYSNTSKQLTVLKPELKIGEDTVTTAWKELITADWRGGAEAVGPFDLSVCIAKCHATDVDSLALKFVSFLSQRVLQTAAGRFIPQFAPCDSTLEYLGVLSMMYDRDVLTRLVKPGGER